MCVYGGQEVQEQRVRVAPRITLSGDRTGCHAGARGRGRCAAETNRRFWGRRCAGGGTAWGWGRILAYRGSLKRNARAVQLFGRPAVLETHTLRY